MEAADQDAEKLSSYILQIGTQQSKVVNQDYLDKTIGIMATVRDENVMEHRIIVARQPFAFIVALTSYLGNNTLSVKEDTKNK